MLLTTHHSVSVSDESSKNATLTGPDFVDTQMVGTLEGRADSVEQYNRPPQATVAMPLILTLIL